MRITNAEVNKKDQRQEQKQKQGMRAGEEAKEKGGRCEIQVIQVRPSKTRHKGTVSVDKDTKRGTDDVSAVLY